MSVNTITNIDEAHYLDGSRFGYQFLEFMRDQAIWSQKTFGTDAERGPVGPLKHLIKEVQECLANPKDPMEYADLLILVADASRRAGLTPWDLLRCARAKMRENKEREWPEPSPDKNDEAVEHVREQPQAPITAAQIQEYRDQVIRSIETALQHNEINGHTALSRLEKVRQLRDQDVIDLIRSQTQSRDTWAAMLRLSELAVTEEVAEAIEDMKGPNPVRPTSMVKLVNDLQDWLDNRFAASNRPEPPTASWCTTATWDSIAIGSTVVWNSEEGYSYHKDPKAEDKDTLTLRGCQFAYESELLAYAAPFIDGGYAGYVSDEDHG